MLAQALTGTLDEKASLPLMAEIVDGALDAVVVADLDGVVRAFNPAAEALFGHLRTCVLHRMTVEALIPRHLRAPHKAGFHRFVTSGATTLPRLRRRTEGLRSDGSLFPLELTLATAQTPSGPLIVAHLRDLTSDVAHEQELLRLATVDPLTGLLNRRAGEVRIEEALAAGEPVALVLIDLDHFKDVNDGLGHAAGDQVLRTVADRLTAVVPPGGSVSRLGGDELLVALVGAATASVEPLTEAVLGAVAQPVVLPSCGGLTGADATIELTLTASIGLSGSPEHGTDLSTLLARADSAMFAAKRAGRNGYAHYTADTDRAHRRLSVTSKLRRALANGAVDVHYQPLLRLRDDRTVAFEALARWTDPDLGPVSPLEFVGLAEETGLIPDLTDLVLHRAATAAACWSSDPAFRRPDGAPPLKIGVNLAAGQLGDPGLARRLAAIVSASGLAPDSVVLELTESATIGDAAAGSRALRALRDEGFMVVLDDFGVGYSSLARLGDLSADRLLTALKLDRSFVAALPSPRAQSLIAAFVQVATAMGLITIAEGIETPAQLEAVRQLGCVTGQGYLFAPAVSLEAASAWLLRDNARQGDRD